MTGWGDDGVINQTAEKVVSRTRSDLGSCPPKPSSCRPPEGAGIKSCRITSVMQ